MSGKIRPFFDPKVAKSVQFCTLLRWPLTARFYRHIFIVTNIPSPRFDKARVSRELERSQYLDSIMASAGAGVVGGAVAPLTVEQKEWIADQIIAKKQSAKEIAEQYHLKPNFVCSLARRRRKGQALHATGGRPPGAKNKGPTVKKKLRAPGVVLEIMPGMGDIALAAPNIGANELPNPPEPVALRRASARVAGLPSNLL